MRAVDPTLDRPVADGHRADGHLPRRDRRLVGAGGSGRSSRCRADHHRRRHHHDDAADTTTRPAPTTTAVTTTTEAGPPPRSSQRVAAAVDIEKIRPTSLPLRTMAIATAVVIAGLAIAGFFYGRVRSRIPAVADPETGPVTTVQPPGERRHAGRQPPTHGSSTDTAPAASSDPAAPARASQRVGATKALT